jgi:hypothetical protein
MRTFLHSGMWPAHCDASGEHLRGWNYVEKRLEVQLNSDARWPDRRHCGFSVGQSVCGQLTSSISFNRLCWLLPAPADCLCYRALRGSNPCLSASNLSPIIYVALQSICSQTARCLSLNYHLHYCIVSLTHSLGHRRPVHVHCGFDVRVPHQVRLYPKRRAVVTHP